MDPQVLRRRPADQGFERRHDACRVGDGIVSEIPRPADLEFVTTAGGAPGNSGNNRGSR